jgi:hypothetical protein
MALNNNSVNSTSTSSRTLNKSNILKYICWTIAIPIDFVINIPLILMGGPPQPFFPICSVVDGIFNSNKTSQETVSPNTGIIEDLNKGIVRVAGNFLGFPVI